MELGSVSGSLIFCRKITQIYTVLHRGIVWVTAGREGKTSIFWSGIYM